MTAPRPRRVDKIVRQLHDLSPHAVVHLGDAEFDAVAHELGADLADHREIERARASAAIWGQAVIYGTEEDRVKFEEGRVRRHEFTIERPNGPIVVLRDSDLKPREQRVTWWPAR